MGYLMQLLATLALLTSSAEAACPYVADRTVCASGCDHTTLSAAISASSAGDAICVSPGTYTQPLTVGIDLLIGAVDPGVILSASSGTEMLRVQSGASVELSGVELAGSASRRCVIVTGSASELVLVGGEVRNCAAAGVGPGVYLQNGTSFRATGTSFVNNGNNANDGGAVFADNAAVTLSGGTFLNNIAQDGGAVAFLASIATLTDVTFDTNLASGNGGAVWSNADLTVVGGTFQDNVATAQGGAVYASGGTPDVDGATFLSNDSTSHGGAVALTMSSSASVRNSLFQANTANGNAGGVYVSSGSVTVDTSTFFTNHADNGGAVSSVTTNSLTIKRSDFWNNEALAGDGGAVHAAADATTTINNNIFATNQASGAGGALRTHDTDAAANNNVFVDNVDLGSTGDAVAHSQSGGSDNLTLRNNIFTNHTQAIEELSGNLTSTYNAFYQNTTNFDGGTNQTNSLLANPSYVSFDNDNTFDDNLLVQAGSPCVDGGDPAVLDAGGGRSDIGIGGGPDSRDVDRDRVMPPADCDDTDSAVYAGAVEIPGDGVDEDCDGQELCFTDADDDGYGDPLGLVSTPDIDCSTPPFTTDDRDCDDTDDQVSPDGVEVPNDDLDQDCDGFDSCFADADLDGRGSAALVDSLDLDCFDPGEATTSADCDDTNPDRFPGNPEVVGDLVDQDCDGHETCYQDDDQDTFGDVTTAQSPTPNQCLTSLSLANDSTDCNDGSFAIKPGATEIANDEVDQNCDGQEQCFDDNDGDGYGVTNVFTTSTDVDCDDVGETTVAGDCNDAAAGIHPTATEVVADGVDQDCDTDELCYRDVDGDSFAGTSTIVSNDLDCTDGAERSTATDCNDNNAAIKPTATELAADGIDQNCNGGDGCYRDDDDDGYGVNVVVDGTNLVCTDANESTVATDCDDTDDATFPGAPEVVADGIDQSCNNRDVCYVDNDRDTYGDTATIESTNLACTAPGFANDAQDCDDAVAAVHPGAAEVTGNNRDDDCDGGSRCYVDGDRDGYGTSSTVESPNAACSSADGEADDSTDCDDGRAATNPGATEVKENGIDDNCNGFDLVDCLIDGDDDGYGIDTGASQEFEADCGPLLGFTPDVPANRGDCDDADTSVNPGAADVPGDGIDSNCDGILDEDGDGLSYAEELSQGSRDDTADTDSDGLTDLQEYLSCTDLPTRTGCLDPASADTDGDGLTDLSEFGLDTDGDGTQDGLDQDDDGDTVPTAIEVATLPFDADGDGTPNQLDDDDDGDTVPTADEDTDGDGDASDDDTDDDSLPNWLDDDDDDDTILTMHEELVGSDPYNGDTDGDSVPDEVEWDNAPGEPLQSDGDGVPDILDEDDDGDGLDTLREQQELSPDGDGVPNFLDADSDNDGRPDAVELDADDDDDSIPNFVDFNDTDGRDGDGDLDGLSNGDERTLGTDPIDPDTDHDLQLDGWEVTATPAHRDTDSDGTPDALDDDDDGDGALSWDESGLAADTLLDSLCDECSVCAVAFVGLDPDPVLSCDGVIGAMPPRSSLRDSDGDGVADTLDDDDDDDGRPTRDERPGNVDGDCVDDAHDVVPTDGPSGDHDTDGVSNLAECDLGLDPYAHDTDQDGVEDGVEFDRGDSDDDGVIDALDLDDDDDGVPTRDEGTGDADADGVPDYLDDDSDDDGVSDGDEGTGDTDCDGVPDRLDGQAGVCVDPSPGQVYQRSGCAHGPGAPSTAALLALLALGAAGRRREARR